jgi:hypothetical protein
MSKEFTIAAIVGSSKAAEISRWFMKVNIEVSAPKDRSWQLISMGVEVSGKSSRAEGSTAGSAAIATGSRCCRNSNSLSCSSFSAHQFANRLDNHPSITDSPQACWPLSYTVHSSDIS